MPRPLRLPLFLLLLLQSATLLARLWLIRQGGFDGLYGQDPYAYYNYAVGPLRDSLLALAPPPPFHWPPGYPYLVALASFLVGVTPPAGQLVSLLASLLIPIFTYGLAWEVWGRPRQDSWTPLLAALLVAANGQFWQSSIVVMSDLPALAAASLGIWSLARYGRQDGQATAAGWLWLAAAALAYAILTRWAYALVAIPATIYALWLLWQRPRRQAAAHALGAAVCALLPLLPILPAVFRFVLDPAGAGNTYIVDLQVYRWNPLNALRRSFITADGLLQYRWPNGLYYTAAVAHRYYFTPLLALLLLLPGLAQLIRQRTAAIVWLILAWAGLMLLFLVGAAWQNFRFTLAYLPPMAIIAAVGGTSLVHWLAGRQRPLALLPAGIITLGLLWMAYGGWSLSRSFVERKQADLALITWVDAQTEADGRLLAFGQTLALQQYGQRETVELFYQTPDDLARYLADGRPHYLLLDVDNVTRQWAGRAPGDNYAWLRNGPGLRRLGQQGAYTLFAVNAP